MGAWMGNHPGGDPSSIGYERRGSGQSAPIVEESGVHPLQATESRRGKTLDDQTAPLDDQSIELGQVRRSTAVLPGDGEVEGGLLVNPRELGDRPGIRALHVRVEVAGAPA